MSEANIFAERDERVDIRGIFVLLITALAGGVAVGVALHLSGRLMYLICVSPIFASAIAGFIFYIGIIFTKVRNGALVLAFGVLMGVVAYTTFQYGDYLWFLDDTRGEFPGITNDEINFGLKVETGSSGFIGYVRYQAQEGLNISSVGSSIPEGSNIPESLTWIYFGIELLTMTAGPILMGFNQANEPFCENTNEWLEFNYVGSVSNINSDQFLQAMQAGDFSTAGTFLSVGEQPQYPYLMVEIGDCGADQPTGMLRVHAMNVDNQGRDDNKMVIESNLTRQEIKALNR